MKTLYAIRDRVANDIVTLQMYSLFTFKADAQAIRYFADAIYDEKSVLSRHPDDYELIRCGTLDDSGQITPELHPVTGEYQLPFVIVTGTTLKAFQETK